MGKVRRLGRRVFMIGTVAIAGGVAFGVYKYRTPHNNPLLTDGRKSGTALNPFLFIDESGITIVTPRAEMGQGVHTTLAAMVAEELDVLWEDIRTEHGPAGAAYFNRVALQESLPFPAYQDGPVIELARNSLGVVAKFLGMQITGGSTSTPDGFWTMRMAGAAARAMLIAAAANRWTVDADTLRTADGQVVNPASGEKLAYTDLAADAATMQAPQNPPLKDPSQWRYLGKTMPRVDMLAKVTGRAQYGIDVRFPEMVFATVKSNPRLGAPMNSYDASQAKAMKGVLGVVSLGDGVGVIADNTWRAFRAADTVKFDWAPAAYPESTEKIFAVIEKSLAEGKPDAVRRDDGDAPGAIDAAGEVIEASYRLPYLAHATMEPMNAVALLSDNRLDIWTGTQAPTVVRDVAASVADLNTDQVHVHTEFMGGGFGRRVETDYVVHAVKLAKEMKGKAVKMTWTRPEDMRHDMYRPAAIGQCRGLMGTNGVPRAVQIKIASPSVMRGFLTRMGMPAMGPDKLITDGAGDQPYEIEHYQVAGYAPDVAVPVGTWRSVGASYNSFIHECFLDELALAAKVDPIDMRLAMMSRWPAGQKVLRAVAEMSNWGSELNKGQGRGVAFCYSFGC